MSKLKVVLTCDTEIWPGSWDRLEERFPAAFRRYVYGDTPHGEYALPMKLRILQDHGLRGVYFVEPLFSARFGIGPLQEIIGLIREAGQDVQMHLHAEWADEAREPVLPKPATRKRQHISYFSLDEQVSLISWARDRLVAAGAPAPAVFRAGSLHFNLDTLRALQTVGISRDSSYSHCLNGPQSGLLEYYPPGCVPTAPSVVAGMEEYPLTVFWDGARRLRPLQLSACSLKELVSVLDRSAERQHPCVNILTHNFELLDRRDFSVDNVVVRRFMGLCEYLYRNSDRFETVRFQGLPLSDAASQHSPVSSTSYAWLGRVLEQASRRLPPGLRQPTGAMNRIEDRPERVVAMDPLPPPRSRAAGRAHPARQGP